MANLIVIARNDQPKREEHYPQTWLLYKGDDMTEVHVAHDSLNRPRVLAKGAA
jgi:hypothetical protein